MGRSGGAADPWPWRKLRWAKQRRCKIKQVRAAALGDRQDVVDLR